MYERNFALSKEKKTDGSRKQITLEIVKTYFSY